MKKDKKSSGGALSFVLLKETGVPFMDTVEEERARIIYEKFRSKIREVLV
jgi:3-dehydroquinate synthase